MSTDKKYCAVPSKTFGLFPAIMPASETSSKAGMCNEEKYGHDAVTTTCGYFRGFVSHEKEKCPSVTERQGWDFGIGTFVDVPGINTKEECLAYVVNNELKYGTFRTESHAGMPNTCFVQKVQTSPSEINVDRFNAALGSNLNDPDHLTFLLQ